MQDLSTVGLSVKVVNAFAGDMMSSGRWVALPSMAFPLYFFENNVQDSLRISGASFLSFFIESFPIQSIRSFTPPRLLIMATESLQMFCNRIVAGSLNSFSYFIRFEGGLRPSFEQPGPLGAWEVTIYSNSFFKVVLGDSWVANQAPAEEFVSGVSGYSFSAIQPLSFRPWSSLLFTLSAMMSITMGTQQQLGLSPFHSSSACLISSLCTHTPMPCPSLCSPSSPVCLPLSLSPHLSGIIWSTNFQIRNLDRASSLKVEPSPIHHQPRYPHLPRYPHQPRYPHLPPGPTTNPTTLT
jgi:hypothetical protein